MGFGSIRSLVEAQEDHGRIQYSTFYKRPVNVNDARAWLDLSMVSGNPRPNFYASNPCEAAVLNPLHGIFHGGNVAPKTKHLVRLAICGTDVDLAGSTFLLCDYLLYYPFIDMDSTEEQILDNPVSLPRYVDGNGVYAVLVASATFIGGARVSINYTNQSGITERTSLWTRSATPTNPFTGMLINSTVLS
jgi:hypothetical protein